MLLVVLASAYDLPCQRTESESSENSHTLLNSRVHSSTPTPELGTPHYKRQNIGSQ